MMWLNKIIDWELELRYRATLLWRGLEETKPLPKPEPQRSIDSSFLTDLMNLGEQDAIEMAAFSMHRGQTLVAEAYREDAGYGGLERVA